jgi:superfamily II RNA helicase
LFDFPDQKIMEKENAKKQTLEQLHERRKQVVRLHKKAIKIMQIVAMTGLSYLRAHRHCQKRAQAENFALHMFTDFVGVGFRENSYFMRLARR